MMIPKPRSLRSYDLLTISFKYHLFTSTLRRSRCAWTRGSHDLSGAGPNPAGAGSKRNHPKMAPFVKLQHLKKTKKTENHGKNDLTRNQFKITYAVCHGSCPKTSNNSALLKNADQACKKKKLLQLVRQALQRRLSATRSWRFFLVESSALCWLR